MQTGCGRGCVSKPPSRKTYEDSPTGIKCGNKTVTAESSRQAAFHLALLGTAFFSMEHLSIRVAAKQMAHCITEEILIKGLLTKAWQVEKPTRDNAVLSG